MLVMNFRTATSMAKMVPLKLQNVLLSYRCARTSVTLVLVSRLMLTQKGE